MSRRALTFYLLTCAISLLFFVPILLLDRDNPGQAGTAMLFTLCYMFGPGLGAISAKRFFFQEKVELYGLDFKGIQWKKMFRGALIPGLVLLLFAAYNWLFGNFAGLSYFGTIDFSSTTLIDFVRGQLEANPELSNSMGGSIIDDLEELPIVNGIGFFLLLLSIPIGIVAGFTLNVLPALGEEYGWRGVLLAETRNMGFVRSSVLIGVLWGLWHAPLIVLGHNYPNQPVAGILTMVLFCIPWAFFLNWITIKSKSIWAAAGLHGTINATFGTYLFFTRDGDALFGSPMGVAGILAISTVVILILKFDAGFLQEFKENGIDQGNVENSMTKGIDGPSAVA